MKLIKDTFIFIIITFTFLNIYAKESINLRKVVTIKGPGSDHSFGKSAYNLGDINNDGYEDLAIIGEPQDSTIYRTRKAYIYYGGIPFDTIPDLTFQRDFEMILHGNMDINGDGLTDVIITNDPDMYAGMFSIYLGSENGPSFNSEPDYELYGEIYGSNILLSKT